MSKCKNRSAPAKQVELRTDLDPMDQRYSNQDLGSKSILPCSRNMMKRPSDKDHNPPEGFNTGKSGEKKISLKEFKPVGFKRRCDDGHKDDLSRLKIPKQDCFTNNDPVSEEAHPKGNANSAGPLRNSLR